MTSPWTHLTCALWAGVEKQQADTTVEPQQSGTLMHGLNIDSKPRGPHQRS